MLYETGDVLRDYDAARALDFSLAFQLVPLDLTGCTAVMKIAGLVDLTMTVAVSTVGANKQSTLSALASAATTSAWTAGIYDYRIEVTYAGGQKQPMGRGKVVVS